MPKRTGGITVGFLGTGTMEVNAATDLIEEFVNESLGDSDEGVRFLFPLTTDEFTDTMGDLVNMAKASEIIYDVVRNTGDKERRAFQEIAANAAKTYDVPNVFDQMELILTEAPRSILMVLWDGEREEELTEVIGKFIDAEIDTRDLTDGLTRLGNEDDGEAAAAPEPEEVGEDEEAEEAEVAEVAVATGEVVHARSDLEKLSRDEIKAIAGSLGLPPRRSSAAMIDEILAAQEEAPQSAPDSPVSPQEPPVEVIAVAVDHEPLVTVAALVAALDEWAERLSSRFDDFLNRLDKVEIKVATPAPAEEAAPAPRRLRRG